MKLKTKLTEIISNPLNMFLVDIFNSNFSWLEFDYQ